jgi:hypothetical protein
MKICLRCQKTYADDNLNFCLEDGSVLSQYGAAEPPPTVMMSEPRVTEPQQPTPSQPGGQPAWSPAPQPYSMQPPKKSSKAWVWVLLILGAVALLCGGGIFATLIMWSQSQTTNVAVSNSRSTTATRGTNSTSSTTTETSGRDDVEAVDLSSWVQEFSIYGITQFTDDEFIMSSKNKGYYYVLVGREDNKTDDADTRVTLRNVDNADSRLGYGLVFHSNPTPLQQDYAFLIDTKRKKYRVVRHAPQKEVDVVKWTSSDAIKEGSAENLLEARASTGKVELYINGTMVSSIKNTHGYAGGVAGLYSGDGAKIAFKDLEIRK